MESYCTYSFVSLFFFSTQHRVCDSSMLLYVAVFHLYLLLFLCRFPLCDYTIIYLSVLLLMKICIIFSLGLLWILLFENNSSVPFEESIKRQTKLWIVSWLVTMLIKLINCPGEHFENIYLKRSRVQVCSHCGASHLSLHSFRKSKDTFSVTI